LAIKQEKKNTKVRPERSLRETGKLYHNFLKRTGRYSFIGKNLVRLILVLGGFGVAAWLLSAYVLDVDALTTYISNNFPVWMIVGTLFLSESLLGLMPPDAFIVWVNESFSPAWPMILLLATASYAGGVISWFIGKWLYRFPRVKEWVHIKFSSQFLLFRKYGGLLIFIAAMTPLPFSPVSIVAGVVNYRFARYLIMALSRFLRFFLYAYIFDQVVI
jgi:membrane protein YqaA with SNARE-associated domain